MRRGAADPLHHSSSLERPPLLYPFLLLPPPPPSASRLAARGCLSLLRSLHLFSQQMLVPLL